MPRPIINLADAPTSGGSHGDTFAYRMSELAGPLGARAIGANVTRVPPGRAAFPFHHHFANEEHFFVLSGTGVLRLGDEVHPVRPNDYIVNLPGDAGLAHQLVNTGSEDLVYLAVSTRVVPEVVGYPDTGKTGVRAQALEGPNTRFLVRGEDRNRVDYWEGEDGARVRAILEQGAGSSRDG